MPCWHRCRARSHGARHSAPRASICQVRLYIPLRESFAATRWTGYNLPVESTSHRQAPAPQLNLPNSFADKTGSVEARHANAQDAYLLICCSTCLVVLSWYAAQRATRKSSKFSPYEFVGTSRLLSPYTRSAPSMMVWGARPPQPRSWFPKKPT